MTIFCKVNTINKKNDNQNVIKLCKHSFYRLALISMTMNFSFIILELFCNQNPFSIKYVMKNLLVCEQQVHHRFLTESQ